MNATERKRAQRARNTRAAEETLLVEFAAWLRFRGYAQHTIYAWVTRTRRFYRLAGSARRLASATNADLERLWPTRVSASTHNNYRATLVSYYRFLGQKENPALAVEPRKRPKRKPRPYDRLLQERYLAAAQRLSVRHYALACLGVYAGLRLSECAGLRWSDTGERLFVRGKGDNDRSVPVASELRKALLAWRTKCPSKTWVFPPAKKRQDRAVTPHQLWLWHQEVLAEAGLKLPDRQRGFHRTRHTFATRTYEGTHDILRVKKWLGHTNLNTTMLYTEVADDGDSEALDQSFDER